MRQVLLGLVVAMLSAAVLADEFHGTAGRHGTYVAPDMRGDRNTFVAFNECVFGGAPFNLADTCPKGFFTVPKGKIAVIESASGVCVTDPGIAIREVQLRFSGPGGSPVQLSFPTSPAVLSTGASTGNVQINVSSFATNLKSYAFGGAAGTEIEFVGFASANKFGSFPHCTFAVSGYLLRRHD